MIWLGTLRAFASSDYTATVEFADGWGYTVAGVPVSRGIASAEMAAGRLVMVAVTDASNPGMMMVVGVR
jgi:hypothetical protein